MQHLILWAYLASMRGLDLLRRRNRMKITIEGSLETFDTGGSSRLEAGSFTASGGAAVYAALYNSLSGLSGE